VPGTALSLAVERGITGGVAFSMVARSSQRGPRRPRRATRPAARGGGRDLRNGRPDALGDLRQRVGEREADLEVLALEARQHAVGCNTDPELAGGRKDRRLPLCPDGHSIAGPKTVNALHQTCPSRQ